MKDFLQSPKIKIFLSVLLVLIMLAVFTRNVENNFISHFFRFFFEIVEYLTTKLDYDISVL